MAIPVESRETQDFTPGSLKCMGDDAPVFRLKAPSERCRRRYEAECGDDGLEVISDDDFYAEKMKAFAEHWPDRADLRLRFIELLETNRQGIDLSEEDADWLTAMDEELFDKHRPLKVLRRKANAMRRYAPRWALAVYLKGWKNFSAPFQLDAGIIAMDSIRALETALLELGQKYVPDSPSTPYIELWIETGKRLSLPVDEEKNSPSPSQPTATPDASTTAEAAPKAKSKPSSGEPAAASPDTSSSDPTTTPESA